MAKQEVTLSAIYESISALSKESSQLSSKFDTHLALHEVESKKREEDVKESKEWKAALDSKLNKITEFSSKVENDLYHPDTGVVKQNRLLWEKLTQLKAIWWAIVTIGGTVLYLATKVLGMSPQEISPLAQNYEQSPYTNNR